MIVETFKFPDIDWITNTTNSSRTVTQLDELADNFLSKAELMRSDGILRLVLVSSKGLIEALFFKNDLDLIIMS